MHGEQLNRVSTIGLIVLSVTALLTVLSLPLRLVLTGHLPPPEPDEGTLAHIFQLSLAALVPMGVFFLATADWTQPVRIARRLVVPAAAALLALGILYYFEHYYYPSHY